MKITDALRAEHIVFHNLFDHIEKQIPRLKNLHAVQAVTSVLEGVLEDHGIVENVLLLEPLETSLGHIGHLENFHEEHEVIDAALQDLRSCGELKRGKQLLLRAVQLSRQHFDKEERVVFPLIEKQLKAKTLNELGARWAEQRDVSATSD